MTRDEARGQAALAQLDKYTAPQSFFVAEEGKLGRKLYDLERKRSVLIEQIAAVWSEIAEVDKSEYWTRSLPQALHDTLENYQTECGIVAAEAFLKRHGWIVTRPVANF